MKNILYISLSILPSRYANSVHVMKMCSALGRKKIHTTLLAMKGENGDVFEFYNTKPNFILKAPMFSKNNKMRAIQYNLFCLREIKKFDGVIYLRYIYAILWCLIFKKETVIELHNVPATNIHKLLFKRLVRSPKFVGAVFITHRLKDYYLSQFKMAENKCVVLPDCCDIPEDNPEVTKYFDVGYVGHLYEGRGIETVLEVAKKLPQTKFHIIGGRDEEIAHFKKMSTDNIIYYGFVTQGELAGLYKNFSIVLAPYQSKVSSAKTGSDTSNWMSPMKIFEYMAFKKAIILSDLPALREIGNHNEHFLFVKHNEPLSWLDAIIKLQNERDFTQKLITNSYSKFINDYTWDKRVEKLISFMDGGDVFQKYRS